MSWDSSRAWGRAGRGRTPRRRRAGGRAPRLTRSAAAASSSASLPCGSALRSPGARRAAMSAAGCAAGGVATRTAPSRPVRAGQRPSRNRRAEASGLSREQHHVLASVLDVLIPAAAITRPWLGAHDVARPRQAHRAVELVGERLVRCLAGAHLRPLAMDLRRPPPGCRRPSSATAHGEQPGQVGALGDLAEPVDGQAEQAGSRADPPRPGRPPPTPSRRWRRGRSSSAAPRCRLMPAAPYLLLRPRCRRRPPASRPAPRRRCGAWTGDAGGASTSTPIAVRYLRGHPADVVAGHPTAGPRDDGRGGRAQRVADPGDAEDRADPRRWVRGRHEHHVGAGGWPRPPRVPAWMSEAGPGPRRAPGPRRLQAHPVLLEAHRAGPARLSASSTTMCVSTRSSSATASSRDARLPAPGRRLGYCVRRVARLQHLRAHQVGREIPVPEPEPGRPTPYAASSSLACRELVLGPAPAPLGARVPSPSVHITFLGWGRS